VSRRIAFVASPTDGSQSALEALRQRYGEVAPDEADVIVALGGDGFMLRTLHRNIARGLPVYGMKLGTVGFLLNHYHADGLLERIENSQPTVLRPLLMRRCAGIQRGVAVAPDQAGRAYPGFAQ